jgi:hypothetical protein
MMGRAWALAVIAVVMVLGLAPAAWSAPRAGLPFGLMIADSDNTSLGLRLARDLTHEEGLRIIPLLGSGSVDALRDLATVPGADAAIVSSDCLAYARAHGLVRDAAGYAVLARVKPLDLILVARRDIADLAALSGKRIATGPAGSAAYASGEVVFAAAGVAFERVPLAGPDALRALAEGRAEAALVLGRDSDFSVLNSADKAGGGFHMLALPYGDALANTHAPAMVTAQQLPGLVAEGADVETVAAGLIVAVREPPRGSAAFDKLTRLARALYASPDLTADGNNPAAQVPGWKASAAAAAALSGKQSFLSPVTAFTQAQGEAP